MVTVVVSRCLETVFSLSWSRLSLRTQCLGFGLGLETWCLDPGLGLESYSLGLGIGLALTVLVTWSHHWLEKSDVRLFG